VSRIMLVEIFLFYRSCSDNHNFIMPINCTCRRPRRRVRDWLDCLLTRWNCHCFCFKSLEKEHRETLRRAVKRVINDYNNDFTVGLGPLNHLNWVEQVEHCVKEKTKLSRIWPLVCDYWWDPQFYLFCSEDVNANLDVYIPDSFQTVRLEIKELITLTSCFMPHFQMTIQSHLCRCVLIVSVLEIYKETGHEKWNFLQRKIGRHHDEFIRLLEHRIENPQNCRSMMFTDSLDDVDQTDVEGGEDEAKSKAEKEAKAKATAKAEEEAKAKAEEESKAKSTKYAKVPKRTRTQCWYDYVGKDTGLTTCLCCHINEITQSEFEAGHVISKYHNGGNNVENLRPICGSCNKSMGTKNMREFMRECGFGDL